MSEFFNMGGYAWYVWGSYGATFLLLLIEIIALSNRARKSETKT